MAWWWLLLACGTPEVPTPPPATPVEAPAVSAPVPEAPARPAGVLAASGRLADFTYEIHVVGAGEEERLPLVLLLHGRGGSAEQFVGMLDGLPRRVRVLAPHGPVPSGGGAAWYAGVPGDDGVVDLAAESSAVADRLVGFLDAAQAQHPTVGKPIVVGYSQGAMVASVLALRHPEAVGFAVSLSGMVPEGVMEKVVTTPTAGPPLVALHGDQDEVVPFLLASFGANRLKAAGLDVRFESFAGVGHRPDAAMKQRLDALVGEAVDAVNRAP